MDRLKSKGALIDEYITATLKVNYFPTEENIKRHKDLYNLVHYLVPDWFAINTLFQNLYTCLETCWNAQETVMLYRDSDVSKLSIAQLQDLCIAALTAQKTNAERCKLVREIDKVLGEFDRTYLEKTYA